MSFYLINQSIRKSSSSEEEKLTLDEYHKISDETMDQLYDFFEDLGENELLLSNKEYDVEFSVKLYSITSY